MRDGFELNKIAAAVLLAGVVAMTISIVVNAVYDPKPHHAEDIKRGYEIEVADSGADSGEPAEEKPIQIAAFFAEADASKGESLTKACQACHNFEKGGPNKVGPNLWGIVGSKTAHKDDYSYSNALASFNSTWDYQALSQFLEKPKKYVPGTKMAYAGMKKPEDRANVLAYLRTLSDNPVPFPEAPKEEEAKPEDKTDATTDASQDTSKDDEGTQDVKQNVDKNPEDNKAQPDNQPQTEDKETQAKAESDTSAAKDKADSTPAGTQSDKTQADKPEAENTSADENTETVEKSEKPQADETVKTPAADE